LWPREAKQIKHPSPAHGGIDKPHVNRPNGLASLSKPGSLLMRDIFHDRWAEPNLATDHAIRQSAFFHFPAWSPSPSTSPSKDHSTTFANRDCADRSQPCRALRAALHM